MEAPKRGRGRPRKYPVTCDADKNTPAVPTAPDKGKEKEKMDGSKPCFQSTMEEFTGSRFFRVLLEGFSTKLSLPRDLGKSLFLNVSEEREIKKATLISSSNGEVRCVQLCKDGNCVYFGGQKWHEFALAYGLQFGYFLVFRYRGNMIFTFRVFDISTCEKCLPSSGSILDHMENLDINDDSDDEDRDGGWRVPAGAPRDETVNPISERQPVGRLARCEISPNGKPYFEATMAACNITKTNIHLYIPASFRDAVGISMDVTELIINDLRGRSMRVSVFHRTRFRTEYLYRETTIIKGWLDIARANKLKIGDKIIFELVSNEKDELIVIQMLKN